MSPTTSSSAVRVRGVVKEFGGVRALRGLDVDVASGEIVGVVGPNGSGKSTLLSLLSGVHAPSAGSVEILGKAVVRPSVRGVARLGVARTFQTVRLWPSLTVEQTIRMGAYLHDHARPRRLVRPRWSIIGRHRPLDEYEDEVVSSLGLDPVRSRRVGELDHGLQRHVEVARALARRPQLILLDEPAAGLGQHDRGVLRDTIQGMPGRGISVVVVEHALDVILPVSHRVVALSEGTKLFDGPPEACMASPAVKAAYLGER